MYWLSESVLTVPIIHRDNMLNVVLASAKCAGLLCHVDVPRLNTFYHVFIRLRRLKRDPRIMGTSGD